MSTGRPSPARRSAARDWVVQLLVLSRVELTRLLRTEQVHRYVLLPALLVLPLTVLGATLVVSFFEPESRVVAVPADLPDELGLVDQLEERGFEVRVEDQPAAAVEAGSADVAIVGWHDGEGLGRASSLELASRARWRLDLLADDPELAKDVERAADAAGDHWLEAQVAAAGGDPVRVAHAATVTTLPLKDDEGPPVDPVRIVRAYLAFLLGTVAFFFLSLTGVADRQQGVTETLRVLPVDPQAVLWSRLLALLVVQVGAGLLLGGNAALLLFALVDRAGAPLPGPWDAAGLVGALVVCNALYAVVGVWAPSAKAANNGSSIVILLLMAGLTAGVLLDAPAWAPLAGSVTAQGAAANLLSLLVSLLTAGGVLFLTARAMARRVSLVLPEGRE